MKPFKITFDNGAVVEVMAHNEEHAKALAEQEASAAGFRGLKAISAIQLTK